MRLRRRSCLLGFPLLMLALATGRARAAPEPDVASAGIFLRTFGGDAIAIIADRSAGMADRARRFDALFRSCFAIDTVAALVLGRRWKTASAGERAEFTELFAAYVVAAYARRFDAYAGERLVFGQGRPEGRDVVVASWIETRMGNVAVDWRVRRTGGGWRIVDVVVEGISMLVTQRNEVASLIERGGGSLDRLFAALRERTATAANIYAG